MNRIQEGFSDGRTKEASMGVLCGRKQGLKAANLDLIRSGDAENRSHSRNRRQHRELLASDRDDLSDLSSQPP
jgi:hypothetical protein